MLLKTMFRKKSSEGVVLRSPFSKVAPAALIPLFLFILSCSNPTSPSSPTNPTNPTNPSGTNYKVTFESQGGTTVAAITVKSGEKAAAPANPTKANLDFSGWNTKADGSGTKWNFATSTVSKAVTLYAQWTADVTFRYNDETSSSRTVEKTVSEGSKLTLKASRVGYRFDSWNTKADGNGTKWDLTTDMVSKAVTLYAKWNIGQEHKNGDPEPPVPPIQKDKAFVGWYENTTFSDIRYRIDFAKQPSALTFLIYPKFVPTAGYTMKNDGTLEQIPSAATVEVPYNVNEITVKKLENGNSKTIFGGDGTADDNTVTKVYLPTRNLETVGGFVFYKAKALTSLTIPGNVTTIGISAFQLSNLKDLTLSTGLQTINFGAFNRTKIESVTIPSTVTFVGSGSFGGLVGAGATASILSTVTSVRVEALTPPRLKTNTFEPLPSGFSIKVPPGKANAYKTHTDPSFDGWEKYKDKITEYSN